jgi:hypothetical protein
MSPETLPLRRTQYLALSTASAGLGRNEMFLLTGKSLQRNRHEVGPIV